MLTVCIDLAYPEEQWQQVVRKRRGRRLHKMPGESFLGAVSTAADDKMTMQFQVADVRKALAAVWKICENGNVVQFGPSEEDNFIKNKVTGKTIKMRKKGGSYVIDVDFVVEEVKDGARILQQTGKGEITVDSAAEESVCPSTQAHPRVL